MGHTPWTRDEYDHVIDARGESVTFRDISMSVGPKDQEAVDATNTMIAAVNFFHSNDGRTIDTDRIAQGGFWEMVDIIYGLVHFNESSYEAETLLDRLGVK